MPRGTGTEKLISSSTGALPTPKSQRPMPPLSGSTGAITKRKRFNERLKQIKRNGSAIISNVPIIGPGSPKPTVITEIPGRLEKKIETSLVLLGGEGVSNYVQNHKKILKGEE